MTTPAPETTDATAARILATTQARAQLKVAVAAIQQRRPLHDLAWSYYEGDHPALWMTDKVARLFREMNHRVEDNLCALAVDSVLSRLAVVGWEPVDDAIADAVDEDGQPVSLADVAVDAALQAFDANGLDLEQEALYRDAMVGATGYVLVWPGQDGTPEAVIQDPRTCYVHYGSARPNDRRWAVKLWHDTEAGTWRANIYSRGEGTGPSSVLRLLIPGRAAVDKLPEPDRFILDPEDPGGPSGLPDNACPMVPFEQRRGGRSRLHSLVPIQDKINKLGANKMVAAEFAAFRQRVFITQQQVADSVLENAPDRAIVLDPGTPDAPTSVQEFAVTELANYDNAIAAEVGKFFTVASLPRHLIVGTGSTPPSGEQIKADEGPFVAYVEALSRRFSAAWRDVMGLMGIPVKPVWADPEVHNDEATARTVKTFTDAGAPLAQVLVKYASWSEEEALEAGAQVSAAQAQAAAAGAVALAAFDQGAGADSAIPPLG